MRIFDVEELPTHGGSLYIFACHAAQTLHADTGRVAQLWDAERTAGLDGRAIIRRRLGAVVLRAYRDFAERVKNVKRRLLAFLIEAKLAGKSVVGYGAPAKGNTLLNFCGIRSDFPDPEAQSSPDRAAWLSGNHSKSRSSVGS